MRSVATLGRIGMHVTELLIALLTVWLASTVGVIWLVKREIRS